MSRPRRADSSLSPSSAVSWPSMRYVPELGRSRQPTTFSSVDLPDPDGPTIAMASPRSTVRSTPRRAWTGGSEPYVRLIWRNSTTGAPAIAGRADASARASGPTGPTRRGRTRLPAGGARRRRRARGGRRGRARRRRRAAAARARIRRRVAARDRAHSGGRRGDARGGRRPPRARGAPRTDDDAVARRQGAPALGRDLDV